MNDAVEFGLMNTVKENDVLNSAILKLYEAGLGVLTDPRQAESGPAAAAAVADYLEAISQEQISEAGYVYKTTHGEEQRMHHFGQNDYALWRQLAAMLRHPETYKGDMLAVSKAWEVLNERGSRFEMVMGRGNKVAKTLDLTFSWAARQLADKAEVSLTIPHDFMPNTLPHRYCFIP